MNELILVVNDDLFFGGRILSVLEKSGYRTAVAPTAGQAVEQVLRLRPALVIVNMNSKRLGGMDLIFEVRAADPTARILAYLSHMLIPSVKDAILAAGADNLIANSAVSMRLPTIVEKMLRGIAVPTDELEEYGDPGIEKLTSS